MIEKAKQYAINCHNETLHKYDGKPYETHLQMVFDTAKKFIHLIPAEHQENVLAACWTHDVIEDCRQTYNDVKNATNVVIAELSYALTNEKGRSRKDRANDKYYDGIKQTPFATFIKVCDRIANYEYSKQQGSKMSKVYEDEMIDFCLKLYNPKYDELFNHLIHNKKIDIQPIRFGRWLLKNAKEGWDGLAEKVYQDGLCWCYNGNYYQTNELYEIFCDETKND